MSFYETLTAAIKDITENGYRSEDQINRWIEVLRAAAKKSLVPLSVLDKKLREVLVSNYQKLVTGGAIMKSHPGISKFTLERVKPKLRAELDRRIMASAELIKDNREQAINQTLKRFRGWSTSIPIGGTDQTEKVATKTQIRKSLAQLPFEERRVLIDQGHKMVSNISAVIAEGSGAIAMKWNSHWKQANYDYREDHKEIDQNVYAIRGNWALEKGLMNKGAGYTDELEAPAQLPFCRCFGTYYYNLRDLPEEMLTDKGKQSQEEAKSQLQAMGGVPKITLRKVKRSR